MPSPSVSHDESALPRDTQSVLKLAAASMFSLFDQSSQGMLLVDRNARVVWISDGYRRLLPALGFEREEDFVGHPVASVIPNTAMHQVLETGKPILVDLLSNKAGTFLVTRLPLRDESGAVIGALGVVLLDAPDAQHPGSMQPLLAKFSRLQRELDDARAELAAHRRPKYTIASFIGSSAPALEVKRQARRVAATDATVLLLGETGTGKELLAHAIHAASPRARGSFVGVNIAAVPETLLEAEFFGVAPGAFTGAERKGRDGKFKLADGGTLFLDEIGDMSLALQAKLLRVLQERELEPLGSNRVISVDVRVIAATSRDLSGMVREGRFREDLYYRLAVVPIRLPSLRERLADIEALAEALLEDIARRSGLTARSLAPDALDWLGHQPWPGNIRELRNALEQAALMSDDLVLTAGHFSAVAPTPVPAAAAAVPAAPLPERRAAMERAAIEAALRSTGGNRVAAARLLQISRATLYEKLARWPDLARPLSEPSDTV